MCDDWQEYETKLKEKKPGFLSDNLKLALGMPTGAVCRECTFTPSNALQAAEQVPPPWLIYQQRYGPPPSYPKLKIPGLNSPIPLVCPSTVTAVFGRDRIIQAMALNHSMRFELFMAGRQIWVPAWWLGETACRRIRPSTLRRRLFQHQL